jgi:hypothetical protein
LWQLGKTDPPLAEVFYVIEVRHSECRAGEALSVVGWVNLFSW